MPYVKPNTFVDGQTLDASDLNGNDEALKDYINEGVVSADFDDNLMGTEEIQLGDYQPITNEYTFASGIACGYSTSKQESDRSYWTNTIKKGRLNDNNLKIWQSNYQTSPSIYLEDTADLIITFGGSCPSFEQTVATKGFWDSTLKLGYRKDEDDLLTFVEQSRAYAFEETVPTSAGPSGNNNPFGLIGKPSVTSYEVNEIKFGLRRWIGWTVILKGLTAGNYKFSVYVDPKTEEGCWTARTFKAEVFYR